MMQPRQMYEGGEEESEDGKCYYCCLFTFVYCQPIFTQFSRHHFFSPNSPNNKKTHNINIRFVQDVWWGKEYVYSGLSIHDGTLPMSNNTML